MRLIKKGSTGREVSRLCELLGISVQSEFTDEVRDKVIEIQKKYNLDPDGIVGNMSWIVLFIDNRLRSNSSTSITEEDYEWASEYLGCDSASLKAVREIETGGRDGFVLPGKPQILFEGHIFWKYLKQEGQDPEKLQSQFPNLIYPKWTKQYYLGGIREYERFDRACTISRNAAIKSTSFGLFQIMGSNYKACYCSDPDEMYQMMCKSQFSQFVLGISFIGSQGLAKYLASHDWTGFAERYNGPLQAQNNYSEKLEAAWNKYK